MGTYPLAHPRWTDLAPARVRAGLRVVHAAAGAQADPQLWIYDVLDAWADETWGGVSAIMVIDALAAIGDVEAIDVRVNSPGGDYFEGVAIANALRRNPAVVTVHVDGLAASAASVVAMGADRVVAHPGSQMMIHEASALTYGTAAELHAMADRLDQTNDDIAALYAAKAGGDVESWRAAVAAETWYTAAEAVAAGLADELTPSIPLVSPVAALAPVPVPAVPLAAGTTPLTELIRSAVREAV